MTTTPQAAQNPLLKRCYTMAESHLSGYRVVIGFERLEDAQDAHEYIAKLQATQEPVQAGELPDEREAFEATVLKGNPSAVLTKSRNGCYQDDELQVMWWAWQARSALSARKPLTSEQVKALKCEYGYSLAPVQAQADFINGIRCGEKAHGIGLEVKP